MNLLRNSLIGAILVVTFVLFIRWNDFKEKHAAIANQPQETISSDVDFSETPASIPVVSTASTEDNDLPEVPVVQSAVPSPSVATHSQLIEVKTDTLDVIIDTSGGDIVKVALPQYLINQKDSENAFVLLNRTESHTYVAQSGLVGPNGTDTKAGRPLYSTDMASYVLEQGQESLIVDLTLQQETAVITKRFTFSKGSYLVDLEYIIENQSDQPWSATVFGQIKRDSYKPSSETIGKQPYVGGAITTPETHYKKLDFGDLEDKPFKVEQQGGWVAMIQHYFVSAWIPDAESQNHYNLRKNRAKDIYLLGYTGSLTTVAPHSTDSIKTQFYAGPKIIKNLETVSPFLDLTIDFGWLWFIAKPLFTGLDFIHGFVGNWGIAIILLTMFIKVIFFYPSAMSYRSMAKLRKLQPMMADMKDKHGDDRQRMSSELMKLYKKEKVNPLGGCLPILLQMPVFMALYWVLMESVELRHAPFFLWIHDLSVKDPHFILPLLMGATMWIQQQLNPTPTDPMQAKVMKLMPIFFTFLFMMFPAGLVLYWVVNNTLSITQQYIITKQIENS